MFAVNMKNKLLIFILSTMVLVACKKNNEDETNAETDNTEREQAVKDYNDLYLASSVNSLQLGFTGVVNNCEAGTISAEAFDKTLKRINYFRKICGLSANTTWDDTKHIYSQQASLMMSANNSLSHNPPTSWKCYSEDGATGAAKSNIALGAHSADAITLFIRDDGANNKAVGHRRWILSSRANKFALGSTANACALYCIGLGNTSVNAGTPEFVAYPSKYIPQQLVFARWSLSVPNAKGAFSGVDFTKATVTMTDEQGKNMALTVVSNNDTGFGDQTIIWEPQGIVKNASTDIKYHVVVDGVTVNGAAKKYEYDVNIIKP
jgi:uncharacterized protein YkwD